MFRDARRLVRMALPDRRGRIALLLVLAVTAALAEGGGLVLLGVLVDRLQRTGGAGPSLEWSMAGYIAMAGAAAGAGLARGLYTMRLRLETADRVRREAFRALLEAEWPHLRGLKTSATAHILTVEANRVGAGIDYLMSSAAIAMRLPVLLAIAFRLSPGLALGTVIVGGALVLVISRADLKARRSGERMITSGVAVQARTMEALAGRRVIKAFGLEQARANSYAGALDASRQAQIAQQRVFANNAAMIAFAVPAGAALALWAAVRILGFDLAGALVVALTYGRLGQSLLALRSARRIALGALPAEQAINALIAEARGAAEPASVDPIATPRESISLAGVGYRYEDGTEALVSVSAAIPCRAITAVIGASAAGKSTLADIVMGLSAPTTGSLALDGRALDAAGRRAWRQHVGYLPQETFLFDESVRENLLAARPDARDEDLWRALDDAGAAEVVRGLPQGLDTPIGERGARLSGGEAQRIALARALLRTPALLVLDEPTSALDAATEARIAARLQHLKQDHTILLIAHRPALAAIADFVITLDRGQIVS